MGRALSPSLWADTAPALVAREPLPGPATYDVAIVGAGFTGLWTAYYLAKAEPGLRIVVLEAEHAGFGASGRNGGWCSALFPSPAGPELTRAMQDTVVEIGAVLEAEGIEADYHRGGTVTLARSPSQWQRLQLTATADDRLLDAGEATAMLAATDVVGGLFTPHCAAVHPAKMVRGLAAAVERRGVTIHEATPVLAIEPGGVRTAAGRVTADVVVRATEAWTARLPGTRRAVAPVYSLMVATEPLHEETWAAIGLADRQTFSDGRHVIIYGQRTADGRLAFGGRGAPYHLGSRIQPGYDLAPRVFATLRRTLNGMLPQLPAAGVRFTHAWGGPLGIARDWHASVGFDRATGQAWAGGYVGDGVGTTNLAGRTLADLITGTASDLVALPWVGHRSPSWEPEPFRWLGINAGLKAMQVADAEERLTRRPSLVARAMAPLIHG
ncbi:NAD(P)/FAD-dependent oxidoreductase [Nocardioides marmorisolisilvae]|uniref:FAD-dependent oxidoreductase n=1 Tax=Nocardioides marmorisolisilvae TaxID=1542737 RepID=A0A3N0DX02_9ACTN|nr:FAD-dependent oxidoreductase [Nocardioides marmorisolisilvae]RNL79973.1 FAD-dependent oxidoreductase [Nocardioides marmorisolisilvae]